MAPAGGRLRPAAALALLACLALGSAPLTARAAVKIPDEPSAAAQTFDANTDEAGGSLMTPIRGELLGRTFYFEIPHNPVGVLFMAHGCVHDAADFWPASKACPECSGAAGLAGRCCQPPAAQGSFRWYCSSLLPWHMVTERSGWDLPAGLQHSHTHTILQVCLRRWHTPSRLWRAAMRC